VRLATAVWTLLYATLPSAAVVHADLAENATGDWLEWIRAEGAEACPDAAAFAAKIEEHLGRSPGLAAGESRRKLVARIGREADPRSRWSASVDVLDPAGNVVGRRTIAKISDSCEAVADALALVSALVLSDPSFADPQSSADHAARLPPALSSAAASETATIAPPSTVSSEAPVKPGRRAFAIDGGILVAAGLLPGLALGGEVRLFAAPAAWPPLFATFALWQQAKKSIADDRGANLDLWTAGLGTCPVYARSLSWALGACAGGEVGHLRATGFGFSHTASEAQWTFGLGAGGLLQRKIVAGFSVAFGLEIMVPLRKGRVAYAPGPNQSLEVWRASPVAGAGSLRLGYAFW